MQLETSLFLPCLQKCNWHLERSHVLHFRRVQFGLLWATDFVVMTLSTLFSCLISPQVPETIGKKHPQLFILALFSRKWINKNISFSISGFGCSDNAVTSVTVTFWDLFCLIGFDLGRAAVLNRLIDGDADDPDDVKGVTFLRSKAAEKHLSEDVFFW